MLFPLQIIDPTTVNLVTAEKLCGTKNPFERQILHNQVTIIFNSDFITFYKGFLVDFQQITLVQSPPSKSLNAYLDNSATGQSPTVQVLVLMSGFTGS